MQRQHVPEYNQPVGQQYHQQFAPVPLQQPVQNMAQHAYNAQYYSAPHYQQQTQQIQPPAQPQMQIPQTNQVNMQHMQLQQPQTSMVAASTMASTQIESQQVNTTAHLGHVQQNPLGMPQHAGNAAANAAMAAAVNNPVDPNAPPAKRQRRGQKTCPQCNRSVGPNTRRCPVPTCRHEFTSKKTTKRCPDCSRSINHTSRSCVYCRRAGIAGAKRVARGSKSCPSCGKSVGPNTRKCPDCPHVFPFPKRKTTKRCHNCQRSVNRNSRTCLYCRASLAPPGRLPPPLNHTQQHTPMMPSMGAVAAANYATSSLAPVVAQQNPIISHQTSGNGPPPLAALQPGTQQQQLHLQEQTQMQMPEAVQRGQMQMPEHVPRGPPADAPEESWLALGNQSKQKEAAADVHRIKA